MQRVRSSVLTYGSILALVLVAGSVRMTFFPPQSETLKVISLTTEVNPSWAPIRLEFMEDRIQCRRI